jgi:hypothetical protein
MRALLVVGLVSLLGLLSLGAAPQECKRCKDTGFVACPEEAKHACTGTAAQECSLAAACAVCGGTHKVPCTKCDKPPGPEYAAEQATHRAWLATMKPIDDVFARPLAHAKSAHFLLTFDIPKLDVEGGPQAGTPLHPALHLYLDRLEALYAQVSSDLGALESDYLAPTLVFLWAKKADQEKAALVYTRQSSDTESKLMGREPALSIFYDKEWLHDETELHQAMAHQVVHCLLSNVWDGIWPGNIRAGWIDEGFAHAYEIALFGSVRHYCYVESDTILDLQHGSWEPPVRAAVEDGSMPGFIGVAGKNTTELQPKEQLFAWSYVDFLRRAHPRELGPLARALKAKKTLKEALDEALGMSAFQFEEAWRVFVRTNYSLKDDKKKRRG